MHRVTVRRVITSAPEFGDIYGADPMVLPGGDAHDAKRRVAALQPVIGLPSWRVIGRTTSTPPKGVPHIKSDIEMSCNLDRPGWWSIRYLHTVELRHLGNPAACPHYGRLPEEPKKELQEYWHTHG